MLDLYKLGYDRVSIILDYMVLNLIYINAKNGFIRKKKYKFGKLFCLFSKTT